MLGNLQVQRDTQAGLVQHRGATVNDKELARARAHTRTYGLGRVHVGVTPREVGSVCGQHDFVDLVGLNDAIFCREGVGGKRACVTVSYGDWSWSSTLEHILHNDTADPETQRR